jgi:hypothetical protein
MKCEIKRPIEYRRQTVLALTRLKSRTGFRTYFVQLVQSKKDVDKRISVQSEQNKILALLTKDRFNL